MTRHPHDLRSSSPAVQRARERVEARKSPVKVLDLDVRVEELDEGGVDLRQSLPATLISELLDDHKSPRWTGREPANIDLHLSLEASFVRVKGKAQFSLTHPCVRCLNDVPFHFDMDVDLRLVERAAVGPIEADFTEGDGGDDLEGLPLGDAADLEDLDVASYTGGLVKIGDLLREQLFLELPLHPACDSRGAHPQEPCAFDASTTNAGEAKGWTVSRWAGLASLRDKLPPGPAKKPRDVVVASDTYEGIPLPGRENGYVASKPTDPQTPSAKYRADNVPAQKPTLIEPSPALTKAPAPSATSKKATSSSQKASPKKASAKKASAKKPGTKKAKKPTTTKKTTKKTAKKAAATSKKAKIAKKPSKKTSKKARAR